jgi:hypothetical protein
LVVAELNDLTVSLRWVYAWCGNSTQRGGRYRCGEGSWVLLLPVLVLVLVLVPFTVAVAVAVAAAAAAVAIPVCDGPDRADVSGIGRYAMVWWCHMPYLPGPTSLGVVGCPRLVGGRFGVFFVLF